MRGYFSSGFGVYLPHFGHFGVLSGLERRGRVIRGGVLYVGRRDPYIRRRLWDVTPGKRYPAVTSPSLQLRRTGRHHTGTRIHPYTNRHTPTDIHHTPTMDFASILASEISKKRKDPPSKPSSSTPVPPKKYLKRSEIEAQRQREYAASQALLESSRREKADKKRAEEEAEFARREATKAKQKALAEARRKKEEEKEEEERVKLKAANGGEEEVQVPGEMTEEEAVAVLRAMGEPARLFGESQAQRVRRVKRYLAAADARTEAAAPPLTEEEMKVDMKDVSVDDDKVYRQLNAWFSLVLREWEAALEARPLAVKESFQGKAATRSMEQAKLYMGPLFQHFRNRDLKEELYNKICEIVVEAQARRYVKANDLYLRLSIGNAYVPVLFCDFYGC